MRSLFSIAVSLVLTGASAGLPAQANLPERLERAGKYVVDYQRSVSAIVSDEHYVQHLHGSASTTRDLRSEVALIAAGDSDWVFFRDVYRVDGVMVSDRQDRLTTLVTKPSADAGMQARRIADESVRYNIGNMSRTLNTPTQALAFLRSENQGRSTFRLGKRSSIRGVGVVELSFRETAIPRVIVTSDSAPAVGRVWIEPGSGVVVRTELSIESVGVVATFTVNYATQPALSLWLPVEAQRRRRPTRWNRSLMVTPPTAVSAGLPSTRTPSFDRRDSRACGHDVRLRGEDLSPTLFPTEHLRFDVAEPLSSPHALSEPRLFGVRRQAIRAHGSQLAKLPAVPVVNILLKRRLQSVGCRRQAGVVV